MNECCVLFCRVSLPKFESTCKTLDQNSPPLAAAKNAAGSATDSVPENLKLPGEDPWDDRWKVKQRSVTDKDGQQQYQNPIERVQQVARATRSTP